MKRKLLAVLALGVATSLSASAAMGDVWVLDDSSSAPGANYPQVGGNVFLGGSCW